MNHAAYQRLVIAYHGCDEAVAESVLSGKEHLQASEKKWDWLGTGIYFWEHGPDRALQWAKERQQTGKIQSPAVIGALIHLGTCFDLLDTRYTSVLEDAFRRMKESFPEVMIPENTGGPDSGRRSRDCSLLNWLLKVIDEEAHIHFQTVRGLFQEGPPAFEGSGIRLKSHIQIAVRDPACIVGYFRPNSGHAGV